MKRIMFSVLLAISGPFVAFGIQGRQAVAVVHSRPSAQHNLIVVMEFQTKNGSDIKVTQWADRAVRISASISAAGGASADLDFWETTLAVRLASHNSGATEHIVYLDIVGSQAHFVSHEIGSLPCQVLPGVTLVSASIQAKKTPEPPQRKCCVTCDGLVSCGCAVEAPCGSCCKAECCPF